MEKETVKNKEGIIFNLPQDIVDAHCHGRDLGQKHKTKIAQAMLEAKCGNISISMFMPNTIPAVNNADTRAKYFKLIFNAKRRLRLQNQYLWFGVTDDNLIECENALRAKHVVGLKIYPLKKDGHSVTTGTIGVTNDEVIINALIAARDAGKTVAVHCDDPDIIAKEGNTINAEASYVKKIIRLAKNVPNVKVVICHVSCIESAKLILKAQKQGMQIAIELCAHYLWFDSDGTNLNPNIDPVFYKCFNALRPKKHREYLVSLLSTDNPLIFVSSDNAPHTTEEKLEKKFGGLPSNQEMVAVVCTLAQYYGISEERVAQLLSWNVADFLGIKVSRKLVMHRLVEKIDDIRYNNGIVTNPWNGSKLLFPQKI